MTPQSIKYLKKRDQIARILEDIEVEYETDDTFLKFKIGGTKSMRPAAELILSKFGINKPSELSNTLFP